MIKFIRNIFKAKKKADYYESVLYCMATSRYTDGDGIVYKKMANYALKQTGAISE